jgi:hypothetical protein
MRLDRAPWTWGKVRKRVVKHAIWVLIAVATGGAWVFYFADAPSLAVQLASFQAPMIAYLFIAVFSGTTYLLGGLAREQVCTFMCPWPRIQGALTRGGRTGKAADTASTAIYASPFARWGSTFATVPSSSAFSAPFVSMPAIR